MEYMTLNTIADVRIELIKLYTCTRVCAFIKYEYDLVISFLEYLIVSTEDYLNLFTNDTTIEMTYIQTFNSIKLEKFKVFNCLQTKKKKKKNNFIFLIKTKKNNK